MYSKWEDLIKDEHTRSVILWNIPKEAESMDPQERIFIEEVAEPWKMQELTKKD